SEESQVTTPLKSARVPPAALAPLKNVARACKCRLKKGTWPVVVPLAVRVRTRGPRPGGSCAGTPSAQRSNGANQKLRHLCLTGTMRQESIVLVRGPNYELGGLTTSISQP